MNCICKTMCDPLSQYAAHTIHCSATIGKKKTSALKACGQFTQHPVLLPVPAEKHHVISI